MEKQVKWGKWFALGLGGLIGLSHIGMIGSLSNRQSKLPSINLPVGPYTSYEAEVGHNGYKISYKANDPKVMRVERDSNTKGGFLGLANNKVKTVEQYTMDGAVHTKPNSSSTTIANEKSEACIKAIGSAEGTGRLVGSSIGASAAPSLANIPYVGWVAAGWVTMFGGNQGADIGGQMAEDLSKDC
jgi:hypothetical protein